MDSMIQCSPLIPPDRPPLSITTYATCSFTYLHAQVAYVTDEAGRLVVSQFFKGSVHFYNSLKLVNGLSAECLYVLEGLTDSIRRSNVKTLSGQHTYIATYTLNDFSRSTAYVIGGG